jgi:hypothetical protein
VTVSRRTRTRIGHVLHVWHLFPSHKPGRPEAASGPRRSSRVCARRRARAGLRDSAAVEASAAIALATVIRGAERPGWEVLAADVHGLPWAGRKTAVGAAPGVRLGHEARSR